MTNASLVCKTQTNGGPHDRIAFSGRYEPMPPALTRTLLGACCQWGTSPVSMRRSAEHGVGFGFAQVIYSRLGGRVISVAPQHNVSVGSRRALRVGRKELDLFDRVGSS
jgi:hypothetical protein